ncbi:Nn.00g066100.m01.CDS01 [Neocucurbitaria sp. VM-36]
MRLLHISGDAWDDDPLQITLCEFLGTEVPPYMILSHRWREEEVLFADMTGPDLTVAQKKKGYAKLERSCRMALQQKLEYAWIDTCCIDKSSSAELSEAINSMYSYYADAEVCFAFLDDVGELSHLEKSVWFKRGWTLQELIAPQDLYFYSTTWRTLGSKNSLCSNVATASGISVSVLKDRDELRDICGSEKMSWASRRSTTRPEDEAYSLMGLFGVNMPPLYGEGRQRAFRRLQLEIMQVTPDQTLFTWHSNTTTGDMLAPTVAHFVDGDRCERAEYDSRIDYPFADGEFSKPDHNMTNFGLHIQLPMWKLPDHYGELYLVLFSCKLKDTSWYLGAYLQSVQSGHFRKFHRHALNGSITCLIPAHASIALRPSPLVPIWVSEKQDLFSFRLDPNTAPTDFPRTDIYMSLKSFDRRPRTFHSSDVDYDPANSDDLMRRGKLSAPGFQHDVFCVRGEPGMDIAVGMLNGRLWVSYMRAPEEIITRSEYEHRFADFQFPTGVAWSPNQPNNIQYIIDGGMGEYFEVRETPSTRWRVGVRWHYNTQRDLATVVINVQHVADPVPRCASGG